MKGVKFEYMREYSFFQKIAWGISFGFLFMVGRTLFEMLVLVTGTLFMWLLGGA